jgi:hypothetical protein
MTRIPDNAQLELVCMRLADMYVVHPDQIERTCHNCGHTVGIYPSGQNAIKLRPDIKIICARCTTPDAFDIALPAATSREEYEREKRESKPVDR